MARQPRKRAPQGPARLRRRRAADPQPGRAWFRAALSSVVDAVVACDARGRVTFVNPAAAVLLGWGEDEVIGRPVEQVVQIVDAATRAPAEGLVERVQREQRVLRRATPALLVSRAGREIPVEDGAAPILGAGGEVVGVVRVLHDVTHAHRVEEALRRSERRYRSFVEVTSQFAWVTDADGQVVEDVPALRQFTGLSYEETRGAGWAAALHPDDVQRTLEVWRRAVAARAPYETEYRMRRHDGAYRVLQVRGVPVTGERGAVVEWVGTCIDVTERRRTEAELRESESRFRAAVESMVDGFAIFSAVRDEAGAIRDLRFEFINEAGARMNRRPAADHLGRTILELLPAHRETALFRGYLHTAAGGGPLRQEAVEYEDVYGSGEVLRRAYEVEAVKLGDGVAIAWRDRTAREQAARALRESEERLRRAQEIAHLGSWELDLATNALTWSDEVHRIFGRAPGGAPVTYEVFLARVHPDDRAAVDAAYTGSIRDGADSYDLDHRIVREDTGEVRHVHERCIHIRDGRGAVVRSFGMVLDVTERRRAEEALRLSEETFRTIAEGLPQLVFAVEANGAPWYFNRRWAEYTGVSPGALDGRVALVHPEDRDRMLARWRESLRTGAPFECEYRFRRYDGAYRWFLSRAFPVRAAAGEVVRWFGTATDIHDVKLAQEALELADRRKNEFIAVLSHELRNPLAPIANSVYILDHAAPEGEQARRARQVIGRQVAQLSSLVNDLLDVTRITRDRIQLQREPLDLNDLVTRTVEDHRSFFDDAGVRLELALAPDPVRVYADRTRIAQIVGNLLHNAAKFSHRRGCTRVAVAAEGGEAVIRVVDDGVGMDEVTLARLFQPFMQADHSLDRSKGGLGLGLALVKGLTELHGGRVSARSDGFGKGAELVVRLPLEPAAHAEPQGPAAGLPGAHAPPVAAR